MPDDVATRLRQIAEHQSSGFVPAMPAELYRSPDPDRPREVAALEHEHRREPLTDAEQQAWTERTVAETHDAFTAKAVRAAAAVPPAVPPPDATACRAELSGAIRAWSAAHDAARLADEAVLRAQNLVAAADGRLADFRGLSARITKWRADAIRRGAGDATLPTDLARMQAEAGTAADRDSELREAMGQLQTEAAAAHARLEDANHQRAMLAARVVLAEMDRLADALAVLDAKAAALRECLHSAAAAFLIVPGSPPVTALSPRALETLLHVPSQLAVDREFNHALQAWHAALLDDSQARFGGCDADAADAA